MSYGIACEKTEEVPLVHGRFS